MDYLYHYTTLDKLALILKNKTIRLTALTTMDDLQEKKTKDLNNIGKFVFVSCWTDYEPEIIPMWKMYTEMDSGVRIGLIKNPFVRHKTSIEEFANAIQVQYSGDDKEHSIDSFLNLSSLISQEVFSADAWNGNILHQVIYTNDKQILEPQVLFHDKGGFRLNLGSLGKYKNDYWSFQKEWRYILNFIPVKLWGGFENMDKEFSKVFSNMANDIQKPPFDYYDLSINEEALSSMIITQSPQMSEGNKVLLDALVQQYNPKAQIQESALKGLL